MELPNGKWKLLLVDPPWQYENKRTGGSMRSGVEQHYDTLSIKDLCELPIGNLSEANSIMFLWATTPLIPEALEVMKAWGFTYKSAVFWRKMMSLGMGYWFRGQVELCLLGIRGNVKAFGLQKPNFIQSRVRKHSQKPSEMYNLIELLGIDSKIELFARERREGWDAWGDQLPATTQTLLAVKPVSERKARNGNI